jgi:hypothetical protein
MGMIDRIDPVQAAWEHIPAALARVFAAGRRSRRRRDAEKNSGGSDDSKRDESHLSIHGGFLPVTRRDNGCNLGPLEKPARAQSVKNLALIRIESAAD